MTNEIKELEDYNKEMDRTCPYCGACIKGVSCNECTEGLLYGMR